MTLTFFNSFSETLLALRPIPAPRRAGLARFLVDAVARYLNRRRAQRHLETLPGYLLDDVGLTRADIRQLGRMH